MANAQELVERCIKLELSAKKIYQRLAEQFAGCESVGNFFGTLARQEESHAQLLELCRAIANRTLWIGERFTTYRDCIPRLERQMESFESSMGAIEHSADALRLVIEIESSEVNQVFGSVVAASGSDFVRNLLVFQTAAEDHVGYICEKIPELEPDLTEECRELSDRFFVSAE